jgi:hypothetical protein
MSQVRGRTAQAAAAARNHDPRNRAGEKNVSSTENGGGGESHDEYTVKRTNTVGSDGNHV